MTSKLKVNILADGGDNAILTSDGSGSLTINNAALKMTPAFNVRMNTLQSISHETITLVAFDTEIYDTDSAFDNSSSNYKFTVPSGKAGKYYFFASTNLDAISAANLQNCQMYFYKNGSVQHKISTNLQCPLVKRVNIIFLQVQILMRYLLLIYKTVKCIFTKTVLCNTRYLQISTATI